jgi:hypothetical protein
MSSLSLYSVVLGWIKMDIVGQWFLLGMTLPPG